MARPISAQHVAWPRPAHAQRIGSQACTLPTRPGPTDVPASCGRGLPISSHTHASTGIEGPPCTTPWTLTRAKACREQRAHRASFWVWTHRVWTSRCSERAQSKVDEKQKKMYGGLNLGRTISVQRVAWPRPAHMYWIEL